MKLSQALENLKKCFVAPNTIDGKQLNDTLAFRISLTVVDNAVKKGEITEKEVIKTIKKPWYKADK